MNIDQRKGKMGKSRKPWPNMGKSRQWLLHQPLKNQQVSIIFLFFCKQTANLWCVMFLVLSFPWNHFESLPHVSISKALEEISGPKVLMKSIFWFHGFLQWANRCSIPQWGHKFQGKNLYFTFHHEKICINMFNSTHRTNDISKWF